MSSRAQWLIPCAIVGAMLVGLPEAVRAGDDDPRVWLEKMNQALATRNYDGMFMHVSDGRIETMRIVHRVQAGRVTERLSSMDGPGREFVRTNDELTCYLPDKKTILVESGAERGPFLGSLPQFGAGVNEFYQIDSLPSTRILGKAVRVIAVNPKDQFRFGYRLWLDEKTAMPLKTQLCDTRGNVIEQIVFARLDMPDSIADSELAPTVRTEGMRWVHQNSGDNASTDLPGVSRQSAASGIPSDGGGRANPGRGQRSRDPPGLLGWLGDGFGVRRGGAGTTSRHGSSPRGRAEPPREGLGAGRVRLRLIPRSSKAIKSRRSARCPPRPSNSSPIRSSCRQRPSWRAADRCAR